MYTEHKSQFKDMIGTLKTNLDCLDYRLTFDIDIVQGLEERAKQLMTEDGFAGFKKHLMCQDEIYIEFRSPALDRD